jgi:hypothetical protein
VSYASELGRVTGGLTKQAALWDKLFRVGKLGHRGLQRILNMGMGNATTKLKPAASIWKQKGPVLSEFNKAKNTFYSPLKRTFKYPKNFHHHLNQPLPTMETDVLRAIRSGSRPRPPAISPRWGQYKGAKKGSPLYRQKQEAINKHWTDKYWAKGQTDQSRVWDNMINQGVPRGRMNMFTSLDAASQAKRHAIQAYVRSKGLRVGPWDVSSPRWLRTVTPETGVGITEARIMR